MKCAWCKKREADIGLTTCWQCRAGMASSKIERHEKPKSVCPACGEVFVMTSWNRVSCGKLKCHRWLTEQYRKAGRIC